MRVTTKEPVVLDLRPAAIDFVVEYLERRSVLTAVDPSAGNGAFARTLASQLPALSMVAVTNEPQVDTSRHRIQWIESDSLDWLENCDRHFEAIVCQPPQESGHHSVDITHEGQTVPVLVNSGELTLLRSSMRLNRGGIGVFVITLSFVRQHPRSAIRSLGHLGLCLDAFISVPPKVGDVRQRRGFALAFIGRGEQKELFLGELSAKVDHNDALLRNMLARESDDEPRLGFLADLSEFRGFEAACAGLRARELASALPYQPLTVRDLAERVTALRPTGRKRFAHQQNTVYLPLFIGRPAVTSLSQLSLPQQHCVQIVLNPAKAMAEYMAAYLNTPLGRAVRAASSSRVAGQLMNPSVVNDLPCFVPDIKQQRAVAQSRSELMEQLNDVHSELWADPARLRDLANSVPVVRDGKARTLDKDALSLQRSQPKDRVSFRQWCEVCEERLGQFALEAADGACSDEVRVWAAALVRRARVFITKFGGHAVAKTWTAADDVCDAFLMMSECVEWCRNARTQETPVAASAQTSTEKMALAIALLCQHPDWTMTRIAAEVGVHRRTLYNWGRFYKAWRAAKVKDTSAIPRGSKDHTGTIEARAREAERCECGSPGIEQEDGRWYCRDCFFEAVERDQREAEFPTT